MVNSETTVEAGGEPPVELEDVLDGSRTTAYRWDFASDRIEWAKNASAVLGGIDVDPLGRGRAFALHIDPKHAAGRYEGVRGVTVAGPDASIPYSLQYRFMPEGRRGRASVGSRSAAFASRMPKGNPSGLKARSEWRLTAAAGLVSTWRPIPPNQPEFRLARS